MLRRKRRPTAYGARSALKFPPCEEQEPEIPPDLPNVVSEHSITYPRPFQKFAMQLKKLQNVAAGLVMTEPPQKLYPQGLAGAPQRFWGGACSGATVGASVGGRAVGACVTGDRVGASV